MNKLLPDPRFSVTDVKALAVARYGIHARVEPLPGELDQNFHLIGDDGYEYVLKVAPEGTDETALDCQNQALAHLKRHADEFVFPEVYLTLDGESIARVQGPDGRTLLVRVLTFLPGEFWAHLSDHPPALLEDLGVFLGTLDRALQGFEHPGAHRTLPWDLACAGQVIETNLSLLDSPTQRQLVEAFWRLYETQAASVLPGLRKGVIHNDANDYNVLTRPTPAGTRVVGIIDFGDMLYSHPVCDLAIGVAYALLDQSAPLEAIVRVVRGYHQVFPLTPEELEVLFPLIGARLCVSVCMAAKGLKQNPDNAYLQVSTKPVQEALVRLKPLDVTQVSDTLKGACEGRGKDATTLIALRAKHLNPALSLAYQTPLKIVRGQGAYLYDETGRPYLDMVNNVCHVGHCHPEVVRAGQRQMALLNTNTRYLHDLLIEFAQALCATLPEPLRVCTFVCSGSEANDLALRMAQAASATPEASAGVIVVDGAYHGNLSSMIAISPYKFNGPGGKGKPEHVQVVPLPDPYRGPYRAADPDAGVKYAKHVQEAVSQLNAQGRKPVAFFCESIQGVGGQVVMPPGYLEAAYRYVRAAGGVCVADEVQVGLGRVGTHFWAFQTQGVVPDIVTIGKPLGNGHPVAAVVTTPKIAAAFDNGMEYFNTFGGNPVSCAIGLAVLRVIEEEGLQRRALEIGGALQQRLKALQGKHDLIGQVRGMGLFLGVELVRDRRTLEPAASKARAVCEGLKEDGILVTTEGPLDNVLKLKPPLAFSLENAVTFAEALDRRLAKA